ncbi:MAG: hypothetical protein GF307_14040 [candidate division Zixibacteria bacterium]|nr:hypothetical protein [candidate division Zixibacteria bacterium]
MCRIIVSLKERGKKKKYLHINFSDGSSLKLDKEAVVGDFLFEGKSLTEEDYLSLIEAQELREIYIKALRMLARRSHSRGELRAKLSRRGYQPGNIDEVLSRIAEEGYLDDRSFAFEFAGYYLRRKPCGRKLLEYELKRRGVTVRYIHEALNEVFSEVDEYTEAKELADRKLKQYEKYEGRELKGRLYRFLYNRGFPPDIIYEVVNEKVKDN